MNKELKLSVIMPVYGVEKYLAKAIESVQSQTYKNFEIILVDDCSKDNCPAICDDYSNRFENISVIHHEQNKGVAEARNTGKNAATGDYLFFMDPDDEIDEDLFINIINSIRENDADIIVFGLQEDYYNSKNELKNTKEIKPNKQILTSKLAVQKEVIHLEEQTLYGYVWNKFYKAEKIKSVTFKKVTLIEDILFNIEAFEDIETLNILDIAPYHYKKRIDDSLTSKFLEDYYTLNRQRIQLIHDQYKRWNLDTEEVKTALANILVRYTFSALTRNCDNRAKTNIINRYKKAQTLAKDPLIQYANPTSTITKIMAVALKTKNIPLCLIIARTIHITKTKLPIIFSVLKQNR